MPSCRKCHRSSCDVCSAECRCECSCERRPGKRRLSHPRNKNPRRSSRPGRPQNFAEETDSTDDDETKAPAAKKTRLRSKAAGLELAEYLGAGVDAVDRLPWAQLESNPELLEADGMRPGPRATLIQTALTACLQTCNTLYPANGAALLQVVAERTLRVTHKEDTKKVLETAVLASHEAARGSDARRTLRGLLLSTIGKGKVRELGEKLGVGGFGSSGSARYRADFKALRETKRLPKRKRANARTPSSPTAA
jgi:hypothetical protein